MMNLDSNVGDIFLRLNSTATCSPAVESILPADTDVAAVVAALNADLAAVMAKHLGAYNVPLNGTFGLSVMHADVIKPREERDRRWQALFETTPEERADLDRRRAEWERAVDTHANNGTLGWWRVENYRHSMYVRADSCRAALGKADLSCAEMPEWIGVELPDVVEC